MGKLEEALPLKRESLAVKRKVLGDRHPDTLLSVNNLGVLLNDLGRATSNVRMPREAHPNPNPNPNPNPHPNPNQVGPAP